MKMKILNSIFGSVTAVIGFGVMFDLGILWGESGLVACSLVGGIPSLFFAVLLISIYKKYC
jgi:hypothetical protein